MSRFHLADRSTRMPWPASRVAPWTLLFTQIRFIPFGQRTLDPGDGDDGCAVDVWVQPQEYGAPAHDRHRFGPVLVQHGSVARHKLDAPDRGGFQDVSQHVIPGLAFPGRNEHGQGLPLLDPEAQPEGGVAGLLERPANRIAVYPGGPIRSVVR